MNKIKEGLFKNFEYYNINNVFLYKGIRYYYHEDIGIYTCELDKCKKKFKNKKAIKKYISNYCHS